MGTYLVTAPGSVVDSENSTVVVFKTVGRKVVVPDGDAEGAAGLFRLNDDPDGESVEAEPALGAPATVVDAPTDEPPVDHAPEPAVEPKPTARERRAKATETDG